MLLVHSPAELREKLSEFRRSAAKIGLVPTMGALHEGHLSLVRKSLESCAVTVVSIFVNPTQFSPNEDFSRYPRTLEADAALLAGVEMEGMGEIIVFFPSAEAMYPPGFCTYVEIGGSAEPLEGERRPGHFRGVATVVLKLFHMTQPDVAFFGQKDFQQVAVIRQMARELNVPTEIVSCPIIREKDGLAMSSRNRYLSPDARRRAVTLYESLCLAESMIRAGKRDVGEIREKMLEILTPHPEHAVDYVAFVEPLTLSPVTEITGSVAILLAVRIGETRLIDNILIDSF